MNIYLFLYRKHDTVLEKSLQLFATCLCSSENVSYLCVIQFYA